MSIERLLNQKEGREALKLIEEKLTINSLSDEEKLEILILKSDATCLIGKCKLGLDQSVELAKEALSAIEGKKLVVQEYLLNYLLTDEEKHNEMLEKLNLIKKGMYPYG